MIEKIWQQIASVRWTYWILLFCTIIMSIGAYYMKLAPANIPLLNYYSFVYWIQHYGPGPLRLTWWLWALLFVLFLLGVNIVACILERLRGLINKRKQMSRDSFFHQLLPTLIHLVFLVILCSHFFGTFFAWQTVVALKEGQQYSLADDERVEVIALENEKFSSPELIKGFPRQSTATLRFSIGAETQEEKVRFLKPVFWSGYSFHLDMVSPKYKILPHPLDPGVSLMLDIKRDPGVFVIMAGFVVIIFLLICYYTGACRLLDR